MRIENLILWKKNNSKSSTPRPPSRICSYAETLAHKCFESKRAELYLEYGYNLSGLVVCFIVENMYPLCYHHHQRVRQWHQETSHDIDLKCHSVWDFNWNDKKKSIAK
jgi:hypothetical protein